MMSTPKWSSENRPTQQQQQWGEFFVEESALPTRSLNPRYEPAKIYVKVMVWSWIRQSTTVSFNASKSDGWGPYVFPVPKSVTIRSNLSKLQGRKILMKMFQVMVRKLKALPASATNCFAHYHHRTGRAFLSPSSAAGNLNTSSCRLLFSSMFGYSCIKKFQITFGFSFAFVRRYSRFWLC